MTTTQICPDSGHELVFKSGNYGDFLGCSGYPECKTKFSVWPDGTLKGSIADKETRDLRRKLYDKLHEFYNPDDAEEKNAMFEFLKANTKTGKISDLNKDELLKLMKQLEDSNEPTPF